VADGIRTSSKSFIHLKNLHGSLDAVVFAFSFQKHQVKSLDYLHDKEEAAYFLNDLQNLLGEKEILQFPMSYKRPYEYDEIENANVLFEAETLNSSAITRKATLSLPTLKHFLKK